MYHSKVGNVNTRTQIDVVFAVKGRQGIVPKEHKEALHQYMAGIIRHIKQKLIAINSMPDYIYVFFSAKPGTTCHSCGVWAVRLMPCYKHLIPAGLAYSSLNRRNQRGK